jgi:putative nucleotidyltransferase with HDIG domain
MGSTGKIKLGVEALRPGLYVDLELPWVAHPFMFSHFCIGSEKDIAVIRALGLGEISIVPSRSDPAALAEALALDDAPPQIVEPQESEEDRLAREAAWREKQLLIERDAHFRRQRMQVAVRFQEAVQKIGRFASDLRSGPANAVGAAEQVVDEMLDAFQGASEVLINIVNTTDANFSVYTHAVNVTVLSVLLARHLQLESAEIRTIGIGALIHDIGKSELPAQLVAKSSRLSAPEQAVLRSHPLRGRKLVERIRELPPEVLAIVENHHEHLDGSGYPRGLRDPQIWLGVRVVQIANTYDNLCNPPDLAQALSPRDAMATLYRSYRGRLDNRLVAHFIKAMGIYPPGTVVRLSNDDIGMVVSVDEHQLLRPRVVVYNAEIPRWNALMIDLRERSDLEVREVLRPGECPPAIYEYLGISERLGYFYETR